MYQLRITYLVQTEKLLEKLEFGDRCTDRQMSTDIDYDDPWSFDPGA